MEGWGPTIYIKSDLVVARCNEGRDYVARLLIIGLTKIRCGHLTFLLACTLEGKKLNSMSKGEICSRISL